MSAYDICSALETASDQLQLSLMALGVDNSFVRGEPSKGQPVSSELERSQPGVLEESQSSSIWSAPSSTWPAVRPQRTSEDLRDIELDSKAGNNAGADARALRRQRLGLRPKVADTTDQELTPKVSAPKCAGRRQLKRGDVESPIEGGDGGEHESQLVIDLQRQLREKDARLRKLLHAQSKLISAKKEATARAELAERYVSAARHTYRVAAYARKTTEVAGAKVKQVQQRAARSKMLLEERDLAVLERNAAAVKHGVELATKVEELEALRVAKDSEHKKLTENRASLKAALEAKGREALELAAELNVLRSMQEEELREIKEGAERQWADFSGQQRAMLQDRLQRSVGERITTAAEVQIKEIASQLLASKQECEATNGLLRTMRGKFDEMEQTMLDRESTSELNREQATAHAEEKVAMRVECAEAATAREREARRAVEVALDAAVTSASDAEQRGREMGRVLARAEFRASQAELQLGYMTGDVEARVRAEQRALAETESRVTAERWARQAEQSLANAHAELEAMAAVNAYSIPTSPTPLSPALLSNTTQASTHGGRFHEAINGGEVMLSPQAPSPATHTDGNAGEMASALLETEAVLQAMRYQVEVARGKMQRMAVQIISSTSRQNTEMIAGDDTFDTATGGDHELCPSASTTITDEGGVSNDTDGDRLATIAELRRDLAMAVTGRLEADGRLARLSSGQDPAALGTTLQAATTITDTTTVKALAALASDARAAEQMQTKYLQAAAAVTRVEAMQEVECMRVETSVRLRKVEESVAEETLAKLAAIDFFEEEIAALQDKLLHSDSRRTEYQESHGASAGADDSELEKLAAELGIS
jgi:hypothetical protein